MKLFNFKWIILGFLTICVGCETIHTEISIPAEPDLIWSVLTDEKSYKDWHTVLAPVEGEKFQEGATVRYYWKGNDGSQNEVKTKIVEMIKEKKLKQAGGIPGFLTQNHIYLLEPVDGGTRLTQHEEFRGIVLIFWDTSWMEAAYQKSNENLRDRVAGLKKSDSHNYGFVWSSKISEKNK